jgi:hypothetical protein
MGEPGRQYQPVDLLEFKRRLLARAESLPTPAENPLAELARIIGGEGRIVSADAEPRDEASSDGRTPDETHAARPPKTDLEPPQWPDLPAEDPSPHYAAVDPPFSDHADLGESADEEWRSHEDRAPYGNEELLVAPAEYAHLRLRNRKRANTSLYVTVAAVVIAGVLAIFFVQPGGSSGSPADHRADTASLAETPPADANSAPATRPNTSAVPTARADVDAGAQLSSTAVPMPVSDAGAAAAPAAAPANSSPPPQDDSLFLQPRRVQTIPIYGGYGGGNLAKPANMTPSGAQNTPVPGLTFGQVVEAQTLQTTASAAPSPSARDGAGPTNGPSKDVASVEPPKAPARPAAKPAPGSAAAGAAYAAILASPATESGARGMLAQLQRKYGAALGAHRLTYHRAKGAEGTVYEVRAAGLADDEARALCDKLSSAGASCQVGSQ